MQTFAGTVLPGVGLGQDSQASLLDGQQTEVTVPLASASSTLHVQIPISAEHAIGVPPPRAAGGSAPEEPVTGR
jgi:hypothetical protein